MNILRRVAASTLLLFLGACGGGSATTGQDPTPAANWQQTGSSAGNIVSLAIAPGNGQTIYATASANVSTTTFMLKSTNGGVSWNQVAGGLPLYTAIDSIAIDPANSQSIYTWAGGAGMYRSTDGGISWTDMNHGLSDTDVSAAQGTLVVDPAHSQTIYLGTSTHDSTGTLGGGVYKSSDGAGSWSAVNSGLPSMNISSLAIDPSNSQTIYVGTGFSGGGVFKSSNGGDTWSAVNSGLALEGLRSPAMYVRSLAIDPSNSQVIYAGTVGGVYKSSNAGASWIAANNGLSWTAGGVTNSSVRSLAINQANSQIIYAGTSGGGVFVSSNGGGTWSVVNSGLTNTQVLSLVIDPTNIQIIYSGTDQGVFKGLFPI